MMDDLGLASFQSFSLKRVVQNERTNFSLITVRIKREHMLALREFGFEVLHVSTKQSCHSFQKSLLEWRSVFLHSDFKI